MVIDWINNKGPFVGMYEFRVPVMPVVHLSFLTADVTRAEPGYKVLRLQKSKAWGVAPYVGRPFVYMWHMATDDYGRHVCSDAWIHYLPV